MKLKTFILTFLIMSCSIMFGQTSNGNASSESRLKSFLANDDYGTITIVSDFSVTSTIEIPQGRKITIDLNGHTLSTDNPIYTFRNQGSLTIKDSQGNGAIKSTLGIYNGRPQTRTTTDDINYYAQLTIESGVFNSTSSESNAAAIYNYFGVLNIKGGEFYGEYSGITNYGVATIENAYFECLNRDNGNGNGPAAIRNDFEIEYGENVRIVGEYKAITETGTIIPAYPVEYEPTYLYAELNGTKYPSLQAALDACTTGDNTINLLYHNSGDATVSQKEGVNITIDGNGYKGKQFEYTGTIYINGNSRSTGTETLTIQDVNFVTTDNEHDFISCNDGGNSVIRYAHNVTVQDCNFTATGESSSSVVAMRFRQGYNLAVIGGVSNNMHSLMQFSSCQGTTVDGVVFNGLSGVNLNTAYNVTINNSEFNVKEYAVRVGENGAANPTEKKITITNNKLTSTGTEDAVIIVRQSNDNNNLNISENSIIGNTHIAVTNTFNGSVSADANYWGEGLTGPVVEGTDVIVNSYYADKKLTELKRNPRGEDFTGYTSENSIWGETWGNAVESFVVKVLDANGNEMGTTSLNNIDNIINGDVKVTWNIKLDAKSNTDEYWTMSWTTAPSITNMPAKVELWVDGERVSGGDVVLHGPDNKEPIFAAKTDAEGKINSFMACTGEYNLNNANTFLKEALTAGDNVAILLAGTYAVPTGKDLTITGAVDGVVFDNIGACNMDGANVTFNNVTFDYYPNVNYTGLQHCGDMVYNGCTFNGQPFLYGTSETFNKCTFNQESSDAYNVWTYGAKEVTFNECTFNSAGKSVLIYSEDKNLVNNVQVTKCKFIASTTVEGKAAIEMDSSLTSGINLRIDGETTAEGFDEGNVSGNSLWNNKKGNNNDANNDITVVVAGETVLEPIYEAQIGETKHRTLQEALDAAVAGTGEVTVEILKDIDMTGITWKPVTVSAPGYPLVTVNGNNKTITGLTDMLFAGTWAGKSGLIINDLTIANSNIVNDKDDTKETVGVGAFIGYPQASATITLNNCHLVESHVEGGHWTGGLIGMAGGYNGNDGPVFMNLTITNCSVTGSTITGKGSAGGIIGHGSCAAWTNVVIEETTVSGNTVASTGSSTNKAGAVMGTIGAAGQPTTSNGQTLTGGATISATVSENNVTSGGETITTIYGRQGTETGMLYLAGGNYDNYPIEEDVAYAAPIKGYEIEQNADGTYGIVKSTVATIGDKEYKYLQKAVEAAGTEETTINVIAEATEEIEITDGANITLSFDEGVTLNGNILAPNANLTIEGGFINNTNPDKSAVEINGGKLTLNDVNITSARHAVRIEGAKGEVFASINGGDYTLIPSAGKTQHVINAGGNGSQVTVTINGGTFVGPKGTNSDSGAAVNVQANANVTIEDGDFSKGKNNTLNSKGTLTVKGGTFDHIVKEEYLAEGHVCQLNADSKYEVFYAVAKIGTANYSDLHKAMLAAKSGDTVKLVSNVDLAGTEWEPVSFGGTFDGQGHTISNLVINKPGVSNTGFITSLNGTFGNVTFKNATVTGGENTAVVAGRAGGSSAYAYDINLVGTIKVETTHSGYARAGGIVGGWGYGKYEDITVDGTDPETSYIKHTGGGDGRYVAGIVGHADDVDSYKNCTVKNITISGGWLCGGIAGPGPSDGLAEGCTVENIDMGADRSGGLFGWYYGSGTIDNATVKDVTFTDGSTNNGIVGGYGENTDATVTNLTFENVQNKDGKPLLEHVATIGTANYFTFAEALGNVQDGETITLLGRTGSEAANEIEFTKDIEFNIIGTAPNYILPIVTFQNAIVNIKDANFQIPELDARQNATINVINSTIVDAGDNSIVKSYYNGAINIDAASTVYAMQVTTMGYITVDGTLNATWQTNVYGNGLITLNEGATFNTAALHLTAQDYSGRDNTDSERVGKPAEIVVDGANLTIGKVLSAGGADYSYNSSKGINVGTVDGKSAILNIKNGGNVNIFMANGETTNFGAGATVNIDNSTFGTFCRKEGGVATLANNGIVNVYGESTLNIAKLDNKSIDLNEGAIIKDSNVGGTVYVAGKVTFRGDNTFTMISDFGNYYSSETPSMWTVEEDATLTLTSTERYGLGYGDNVTIEGNIENALEARATLTDEDASVNMYGGLVGMTNSAAPNAQNSFTANNAYLIFGVNGDKSFGNKNGEYYGNYTINFNNSVVTANGFKFYEDKGSSNVMFENSDLLVNGVLMTNDASSTFTFNNCVVLSNATSNGTDDKNQNAGTLTLAKTNFKYNALFTNTGNLSIGESSTLEAPEVVNNGTISFTSEDATLVTATEGLTIVNATGNNDIKVAYESGAYKFVDKDYVAEIAETGAKFESLQEAATAAQDGETIVVLKDIVLTTGITVAEDKVVTLNLNDKTVSMEVTEQITANNALITNYGKLTITDGANKNGKISYHFNGTADKAWNYAVVAISNQQGELIIDGGTIESLSTATYVYKFTIDNLTNGNRGNAKLVVKGGTITAAKGGSIRGFANSTTNENIVTIEGGNITGQVWMQDPNTNANKGTMTINGGTITANAEDVDAIYLYGNGNASGMNVTIGGDVVVNGTTYLTSVETTDAFTASITGGTFNGEVWVGTWDSSNEFTNIKAISGGIFSVDPSDYCAENYGAFPYDENSWVVREVSGEQTIALQAGWNWVSSYIEQFNGKEGLDMLQNGLGENGIQIKGILGYSTNLGNLGWIGELEETSVLQMYKVNVSTAQDMTLQGDYAKYENEDRAISLNNGWNWIAYPVNEEINISDALVNLHATNGDVIKTMGASAVYLGGRWVSSNLTSLKPGLGYMYKNNGEFKSFNYSTKVTATSSRSSENTGNDYWTVNASLYPSNMTMIAMTDVEGGNYEVAAFVNGEVRGSSRPVYVEELDAYILILTISGDDVEEMTFKYYDLTTGEETAFSNRINYSNDAIVGSIYEPYMLTRGTTGIGEASSSEINIYPNPTTTGTEINLHATCDKVEVFNTLGVKVVEYQNVDSIDALETAGIYVIRITNNGNVQNCRLVVK